MVKEKMNLQENNIIWPWPWGQGHTEIAQYPQHHVTYASAKFDIATSHG